MNTKIDAAYVSQPVRAKYYPEGDGYVVVFVENGRHHFATTADEETAQAIVRLLSGQERGS